ncbi:MAG: ApbE family lipoprotein [Thermoleophilia bacterium]|nr:ApbE family lipoprotein [Thermoleophilia bacterium]
MTSIDSQHVTVHDFRVMGTDARIVLRAPEADAAPFLEEAVRELQELQERLTRFDPSSELEQLNDARTAHVSPVLLELLEAARDYQAQTEGRFNVGLGTKLIAAGYDQTFTQLRTVDDATRSDLHERMLTHGSSDAKASSAPAGAATAAAAASFDIDGDRVLLHGDARIDLGGLAKGWSADRIAQRLRERSGCSVLVSLGGDVGIQVVDGDEPWPISASVGDGGEMTLALAFGGLATSGWDGRMWMRGEASGDDPRDDLSDVAHHVIDPVTGAPAVTDIARITVIGASCVDAEVWAKALMLVGADAAAREATERGITAIIVRADGSCILTGALAPA